jgi:hypothetical protein
MVLPVRWLLRKNQQVQSLDVMWPDKGESDAIMTRTQFPDHTYFRSMHHSCVMELCSTGCSGEVEENSAVVYSEVEVNKSKLI